ncbi:DUF4365 domain-containing protein [Kribbella sp. NPDC020789]
MGDLDQQQKEWFSRAFLVAVSAAAGFPVEIRLNDVFGVDATVYDRRVGVDWQLKGTASPDFGKDVLRFDLDKRTYDLLRVTRNAPAYLGVVLMPESTDDWINHSDRRLLLRHCGYWLRLTGMPERTNKSKVRVYLPLENRLKVADLAAIMADERGRLTA